MQTALRADDAMKVVIVPAVDRRGHAVPRNPELNGHLESFWTVTRRTPPG